MARGGWLGVGGLLLLGCAWALGRAMLVGAPIEANLDTDSEAQRALRFAVDRYNRGSNDAYSSRVAEVVRVQKQVVAGIKYIFEVKVGRTICRNSEAVSESCAFLVGSDQAKTRACTFEVVIVPWKNDIKLVKDECQ
ncbi:cystatin-like [Paroedura picta]|uniref:cystatin-like n=1 Tax=Paroedura picta TaxID=143630 RepID=UPI001015BD66